MTVDSLTPTPRPNSKTACFAYQFHKNYHMLLSESDVSTAQPRMQEPVVTDSCPMQLTLRHQDAVKCQLFYLYL